MPIDSTGTAMVAWPTENLVTLSEILVAWQADKIGDGRAMQFSGIGSLYGLHAAARLCGVPIRLPSTQRPAQQVGTATIALPEGAALPA